MFWLVVVMLVSVVSVFFWVFSKISVGDESFLEKFDFRESDPDIIRKWMKIKIIVGLPVVILAVVFSVFSYFKGWHLDFIPVIVVFGIVGLFVLADAVSDYFQLGDLTWVSPVLRKAVVSFLCIIFLIGFIA